MNGKIPTTIVSGFPCIGKTTNAKLFPLIFRDLESSEFHWLNGDGHTIHPAWIGNYINSIKALDKSGMYYTVMVSSHAEVREAMAKAGIRYTNIYPEDSPEMLELITQRAIKRGSTKEFVDNLRENYSDWVRSMAEDPNALRRVALTPQTINEWGTWCAYA